MRKTRKKSASSSASPALKQALETHARLERQVGELYTTFATMFDHHPDLQVLWSTMAQEEEGHAAQIQAVQQKELSAGGQDLALLLSKDILDSLGSRLAEYHQQAQAGVSLDQAFRITWELECSEFEFLRELLVSSSNLAELGLPTTMDEESEERHVGRLRMAIQRHTTDDELRREVQSLGGVASSSASEKSEKSE